jgi:hypothetical protein
MYIGLLVKCRLLWSYPNETWFFSTEFLKNTQISNFMKIRSAGGEIHVGGRTDKTNSRFSQFCERAQRILETKSSKLFQSEVEVSG